MQVGVVIPNFGPYADPGLVDDLVDAAEDLGYDGAWFADHVALPQYAVPVYSSAVLDPVACCIRGLARTQRLRFGTDVLVAPYRQPVVLAKQATTATVAAGERLTLAFGVGFLRGEFAAVGAPPYEERGRVTDEYLEVLRLLRDTAGPVSYAGRYVAFRDIHVEPRPAHLPVLVGGNADVALQRAARLGDGWHPLWPDFDAYAAACRTIAARRGELGREGPFLRSYSAPLTQVTDAPPTPDTAGGTRDGGGRAGGSGDGRAAEFSYVPPVPRRPDGTPRFRGTPEQLAGDLTALADAGADHVVVRFWVTGGPDPAGLHEQLRRFAEQVLPAVTRA